MDDSVDAFERGLYAFGVGDVGLYAADTFNLAAVERAEIVSPRFFRINPPISPLAPVMSTFF